MLCEWLPCLRKLLCDVYNVSCSLSLGYRSGVTIGVSSPETSGFLSGWGTAFGLGAGHKLDAGAILQEKTAVHVSVGTQGRQPSISSQISALRYILLKSEHGPFRDVTDVCSPSSFRCKCCTPNHASRVRSRWSLRLKVPMSSPRSWLSRARLRTKHPRA